MTRSPTMIKVPADLKAAVQRKAASEGRTLTDIALAAFRAYVGERVVYDLAPDDGTAGWQGEHAPPND